MLPIVVCCFNQTCVVLLPVCATAEPIFVWFPNHYFKCHVFIILAVSPLAEMFLEAENHIFTKCLFQEVTRGENGRPRKD